MYKSVLHGSYLLADLCDIASWNITASDPVLYNHVAQQLNETIGNPGLGTHAWLHNPNRLTDRWTKHTKHDVFC